MRRTVDPVFPPEGPVGPVLRSDQLRRTILGRAAVASADVPGRHVAGAGVRRWRRVEAGCGDAGGAGDGRQLRLQPAPGDGPAEVRPSAAGRPGRPPAAGSLVRTVRGMPVETWF